MAVDAARAKSLFLAASDIADPAERAAYLERECGGDAELRGRVEALLRANDAAPLPVAGGATVDSAPGLPQTEDYGDPTARVGAVLADKYKLVEEIGEGGMGSVFMAQQTEPFKRAVAVKVVKAGMDSRAVLARFEAERQALAMMDHPNIAKVLDAGTTDGGRPFFVMELVKGTPITRYCDEHRLTPRQRLELFVPVCQAIQHAHQKGIIHRDIKPSNVLVALYDDRPVPKVIDFGVAKAAAQSLTEKTLMTGFGALIGTPEYMSPEQASLNNLDIDTRSDVYSLGVLLYELLTGTTPVDKKSLGKAAILEILRIVREVDAPRPSAKLSTIDTLPSVAANRGTEPAKLSKLMRGELDWLVMKALEKDRTRRYDTANALARDIQRYLADDVVEARPPSVGYRVRKFLRRNRGPVIAASLVLLALVTGIAYYFQQRAERERLRIEQAAAVERVVGHAVTLRDQALAHPEDVSRWQVALVAVQQSEVGDDAAARDRLQDLRTEVQAGLDAAQRDQALLDRLVEIRSAKADDPSGSATDAAYAASFREAGIDLAKLTPAEAAAKIKARPTSVAPGLTAALDDWAAIRRGKNAAEAAQLSAVARVADPDPWRNELRAALDQANQAAQRTALQGLAKKAKFEELGPISLHLLGSALHDAGDNKLAESVLRRAQGRHPRDVWINYELGSVLGTLNRTDEAIRFRTAARAIRPETAHGLAHALAERGDFDEAIAVLCDLVALRPQHIQHLGRLRLILEERGQSLKVVAAEIDRAVAPLHEAVRLKPDDVEAHAILGRTLFLQGKLDEAIAEIRAVKRLEPNRRMDWVRLTSVFGAPIGPKRPEPGKAYKVFWTYLADTRTPDEALSEVGYLRTVLEAEAAAQPEIAAGRTQDAIVHLVVQSAANPEDTVLSLKVAALQAWFGRDKELADTCRRRLELAKDTTVPETADRVAKACCLLPSTEKAQLEAALTLARKAVQLGKGSQNLPWFQMALGMAEYRSGHFAEADAALIAATKGVKDNPHVAGTAAFYRAMSLFRQGKEDEVRKLATEAAAKMKPLPKDEKHPLAGNANPDDLILWLAYKEAKAMIQFDAAPRPEAQRSQK
jgi:serine/threonine protein kinase/Flp pilus assembly protein TadD